MEEDEEDEKEKNVNNQKKRRERCRNNDVIITIYVESALSRCQKLHRQCQPKPRRPWRPPTSKSAYNRKAQLLAYTQQLRQSNSQEKPKVQRRWRVKCKVSFTVQEQGFVFFLQDPFGSSLGAYFSEFRELLLRDI